MATSTFSPQDLEDLKSIRDKLPTNHPTAAKIDATIQEAIRGAAPSMPVPKGLQGPPNKVGGLSPGEETGFGSRIKEFGKGALSAITSPMLHPQDTLEGLGKSMMASGSASGNGYPTHAPLLLSRTGREANEANNEVHRQQHNEMAEQNADMIASHPAHLSGSIAGPVLLGGALKTIPKMAEIPGNIREALQDKVYQEYPSPNKGPTLTPGAKNVSRIAGTTTGAVVGGGLTGGSYHIGVLPGMKIGELLGPKILEKVAGTPEFGDVRNPGDYSMIPNRVPKIAQGANGVAPIGSGSESVARPARTMVLSTQEAAAEAQMQKIATRRASERGMQFAAGMVPREGRSVPRIPTQIQPMEFPGPRETITFPNHAIEEFQNQIVHSENPEFFNIDEFKRKK